MWFQVYSKNLLNSFHLYRRDIFYITGSIFITSVDWLTSQTDWTNEEWKTVWYCLSMFRISSSKYKLMKSTVSWRSFAVYCTPSSASAAASQSYGFMLIYLAFMLCAVPIAWIYDSEEKIAWWMYQQVFNFSNIFSTFYIIKLSEGNRNEWKRKDEAESHSQLYVELHKAPSNMNMKEISV